LVNNLGGVRELKETGLNHLWPRLGFFVTVLLFITVFGALGFSAVEGIPLKDALYFGIVTVATVGYGDIYPRTDLGKAIAILIILGGVTTFTALLANATELFLARREREARIQKLNLIIGAFFSEMGIDLLARLTAASKFKKELLKSLQVDHHCSPKDFRLAHQMVEHAELDVEISKEDWPEWRRFLRGKGDFLLRLLENPSLLEHEDFSHLLRSIFHFREELLHRKL
jgi:voltage-gated potassium channel